MNKKTRIISSLAVVTLAFATLVSGTVAYFSDTEESVGNTFQAGAIDLKIDNESYYNGPDGLVLNQGTTWLDPTDLDGHLFFNFLDIKPGDWGEDTISFHIDSNPAWVCVEIDVTANDDMDCTEPELGDDPECTENDNPFDGDLAQELYFMFWNDDGDNVLEDC